MRSHVVTIKASDGWDEARLVTGDFEGLIIDDHIKYPRSQTFGVFGSTVYS